MIFSRKNFNITLTTLILSISSFSFSQIGIYSSKNSGFSIYILNDSLIYFSANKGISLIESKYKKENSILYLVVQKDAENWTEQFKNKSGLIEIKVKNEGTLIFNGKKYKKRKK